MQVEGGLEMVMNVEHKQWLTCYLMIINIIGRYNNCLFTLYIIVSIFVEWY